MHAAVIIADELKPERSYNININYLKKIYAANHWMVLDISSWYTYFTNRIIPDYTTNTDQIIYKNLTGYSESKGISANLEYGLKENLRITVGGTLDGCIDYGKR